mmetsp:Transcript_8977/g.29743  ORF Transcript_8977/g.29743 Transcript_8977/m.29743 type:complete len:205 (+) Transcript_8977:897-1511(+)
MPTPPLLPSVFAMPVATCAVRTQRMEPARERRAKSARWMAARVWVATQTKSLPRVSRSLLSHLALEGRKRDISMERHASCVPTAYKSYLLLASPSHGLRSSGGSFPCMFHVPTNKRTSFEPSAAPLTSRLTATAVTLRAGSACFTPRSSGEGSAGCTGPRSSTARDRVDGSEGAVAIGGRIGGEDPMGCRNSANENGRAASADL